MTTTRVRLYGPVAVVPSRGAAEALDWAPEDLVSELGELARQGVLPARIDLESRDAPLLAYGRRHVAFLYPMKRRQNTYQLGKVSRRRLADGDRLSTAALLLDCPDGWRHFHDLREVFDKLGEGNGWLRQNHWRELYSAWDKVITPGDAPAPGPPPHHRDYLTLLSRAIEADHTIEISKQSAAPVMPYASVAPAQATRHSSRGVYEFVLARPAALPATTRVHISDQPALRGAVIHTDGRSVVVRFDDAVDFQQIRPQGELRVQPNDRNYQAQREALARLAEGRAVNPTLLDTLVDGRFAPYRPDRVAEPRGPLNDPQLDAFGKALEVPDLLLVQGPPGTGKTRTISEMVAAHVAAGRRVLVTSHTNRAVDNILKNLPSDLRVVRLGSEDSMTSEAKSHTVDSQVEDVRQAILNDTSVHDRFEGFARSQTNLQRWVRSLTTHVAAMTTAEAEIAATWRRLEETLAKTDALREWRKAVRVLRRREAALVRLGRLLAWTRAALRRREQDGQTQGVFASLRRRQAAWLRGLEQWLVRKLAEALGSRDQALAATQDARAHLLAQARSEPRGGALADSLAAQETALDQATGRASEAYRVLARELGALLPGLPVPAVPAQGSAEREAAAWQPACTWAAEAMDVARARWAMLNDWRARIGDAEPELATEIVRYAQVIAATCIGTAQRLLRDIVFDVAVVDEAGQISTANLLVPLVRARRAVLVGDHQQLPPYLDREVRDWAEKLARTEGMSPDEARRVTDLVKMSTLELLFASGGVPALNRAMLNLQWRMPVELARFVSAVFYEGRLESAPRGGASRQVDPLFLSPFAVVDTSDQDIGIRRDTEVPGSDQSTGRGFANEFEARLIAALVRQRLASYRDWAVIVPYRAQAARIAELLARELGDPARVADNVGTVDSFQGGERDLIVYGFTRSNPNGEVGFLREEPRRLNVALTRARRQLVVVGDLDTLRARRNRDFADLIMSMVDHVGREGDLRRSAEIGRLLQDDLHVEG